MRGRRGGRERDDDRRGKVVVNGRVRKTQEELDREMEDYWEVGAKTEENGVVAKSSETAAAPVGVAPVLDDGDIDMIE